MTIELAAPRARKTDPSTSHEAAKFAYSTKADRERAAIYRALVFRGELTPKEIAGITGIDYIEVQRRMSETEGIAPTKGRRDGCRIWRAI